jgi:hypothetical protein
MHVARGSSTFSRIVCRLRYSYRNRYVALNSIRPLPVRRRQGEKLFSATVDIDLPLLLCR